MLDATNARLAVIDEGDWPAQQNTSRDGSLGRFVENIRQRRHMIMRLTLVGAAVGWLASLTYIAIRVLAFSASSEILISNTTLQLSGPDAVVTQILVENSLVENAIELLRSGRVLGRVVDKLGSEEIEHISPRLHLLPWSASLEPRSSDETRKQASIALLRSNTTVKRVGSSQIVLVRARALTAVDAARLTNEIAEAFVQEQYDANAVVSTSAALRERIKVLGPTARIISEAVPPKSKDSPMAAIAMLLGIMLGSALGAGGGLALIGFDRRLRAAEQLAAVTSAECFGYVPRINTPSSGGGSARPTGGNDTARSTTSDSASRALHGWARVRRLIASLSSNALRTPLDPAPVGPRPDAPLKPGAPSNRQDLTTPRRPLLRKIRALGRFLSASAPDYNIDMESFLRRSILRRVRSAVHERSTSVPHIIGVTSCQTGEGKSTLAANLARFIAREGAPVLLIDACSPEMTRGPAQQRKPGLHELLRGTSAPDRAIQRDICPNLDFLPRGKSPDDLDLLWGNLLPAVSGSREPTYKWIILDLPGLAKAVDVRAAGQIFDDLLIVVEWGRATQGQLQQGLRALGPLRERIIGTIINKTPWASIDSETASAARAAMITDPKSRMARPAMTKRRFSEIAVALSMAVLFAALPASATAGDYKLGVSDRVKIRVQEWPDITGEYTVTPEGAVSLPLIGNIGAAGMGLNDLAKEISDRLQQRSERAERVLTAVEIAQYRPFAIMGDVQHPGQFSFRPGLTVIEAISMAGGYYRPELGLLRLGRDVAVANGEIQNQSAKLNRLLAREARLRAAVDGRDDIPLPPELAKQKDEPEISGIMKNEQDALALDSEMKRSENAGVESIKALYRSEIDSLRGHVQALTQEQDSIGTQLKDMRAMAAKGLALAPTMFALERSFAQVASQQMATETAIVRAQENITLAEQRVSQAQQDRRSIETKDLQKTRDDIAEAREKIVTSTQLLHEAQTGAPAEARQLASQNGDRSSFTILRRDGETIRELVADETTLLAPDDVIKIPTVRLSSGAFLNLSRADSPVR
jgi:polysaccharide biosynthesis/export protein ExoF